jgi:hypothetical protein
VKRRCGHTCVPVRVKSVLLERRVMYAARRTFGPPRVGHRWSAVRQNAQRRRDQRVLGRVSAAQVLSPGTRHRISPMRKNWRMTTATKEEPSRRRCAFCRTATGAANLFVSALEQLCQRQFNMRADPIVPPVVHAQFPPSWHPSSKKRARIGSPRS